MTYAGILDRLAGLGGAKWGVHFATVKLAQTGRDVIDMTIGNPDVPTPDALVETAVTAMRAGRTQYSNGPGELNLRTVLAARYSARSGRTVSADQILCFPGTQTSLYAVLMGLAEAGSEVLVGDPMYATYEGVVAASGARLVPVPLRPENGFRISAADIA
ncbi:MAG: aminotransferase class I/II-fold pyridoxal phosphate-dependent enzyme, partial [Albidovulum sp.]